MSSNSSSVAPTADNLESPYGYIPTTWICIMFIVLFLISTLLHAGQAIRYRIWWLFPTAVLAGVGEAVGWGGRYWSTRDIAGEGFTMQITSTIIAPTPLIAANFILLGQVITIIGPQFSRLPPRLYSRIFLACDIVALIVQAAGGAMASSAETSAGSDQGGKIMLGGIVFQLAAITAYIAFAAEFFTRVALKKPLYSSVSGDVEQTSEPAGSPSVGSEKFTQLGHVATRVKLMVAGLAFSTLVIFIRSIYRTIELTDGWHGRIIQTQLYFNMLDGAMIVLAMYTLNVLHPGFLLRK